MPTGYTYIINDKPDLTLKEFALTCATAFGHCIHQKEDSSVSLARKAEVNPYYIECRDTAKKELDEFLSVPKNKMIKKLVKEIEKTNDEYNLQRKKRAEEMKRMGRNYNAMLKKVEKWNPPTIEHLSLKNFMIDQIKTSISYDIHELSEDFDDIIKESPEKYYDTKLFNLTNEYQRTDNMYNEQLRKVEESNRWIEQLYKSL